jgi:hypothetical protein
MVVSEKETWARAEPIHKGTIATPIATAIRLRKALRLSMAVSSDT